MNIIVNAWGESGILNAAALISVACMGMISNCNKIIVRTLCLNNETADNSRLSELKKVYSDYYKKYYPMDSEMVFPENVTLSGIVSNRVDINKTLADTYSEKERKLLSLGCSDIDMKQNIRYGMHGNTRLGEVFFADKDVLDFLYSDNETNNAFEKETIIINTGDYSSDSTAITFIPLENVIPVSKVTNKHDCVIFRYNVLNASSTKRSEKIPIHNPDAFGSIGFAETDIFDIPEHSSEIAKAFSKASLEERNRMYGDLVNLQREYSRVFSENYDYRGLNPKDYPEKLIEALKSEHSTVSASFINLKTDGSKLLPPDVTSTKILSGSQCTKINIVNLLSAVSMIEIAEHYDNYNGGGVYGFGSDKGDSFSSFNLFDDKNTQKFLVFLISALIVRGCFNNTFDNIFEKNYLPIIAVFREIDASSQLSAVIPPIYYSCLEAVKNGSPDAVQNEIVKFVRSFNSSIKDERLNNLTDELIKSINVSSGDIAAIIKTVVSSSKAFVKEVTKW